jgi:hypothetical protein
MLSRSVEGPAVLRHDGEVGAQSLVVAAEPAEGLPLDVHGRGLHGSLAAHKMEVWARVSTAGCGRSRGRGGHGFSRPPSEWLPRVAHGHPFTDRCRGFARAGPYTGRDPRADARELTNLLIAWGEVIRRRSIN